MWFFPGILDVVILQSYLILTGPIPAIYLFWNLHTATEITNKERPEKIYSSLDSFWDKEAKELKATS